jgi:hypothetical protein
LKTDPSLPTDTRKERRSEETVNIMYRNPTLFLDCCTSKH